MIPNNPKKSLLGFLHKFTLFTNLVHFGPYFYVVSMFHFVCVNTKPQTPGVSFLANYSPHRIPIPHLGFYAIFFTFWKPTNMALIFLGALTMWGFYFILFFELNSRAFQLEIKWATPLKIKRPSNGDYKAFQKRLCLVLPWKQSPYSNVIHSIQSFAKTILATKFKHKSPPLPHIHPWSEEGNYLHTWTTYENLQCCRYMPHDNQPLL